MILFQRLLLLGLIVWMNNAVLAQTYCDSLTIHGLTFDPLNSETKVQVLVENESSHFFNYPKFILRNAQNDTVASEIVNFFGIGNYIQAHTLNLHDSNTNTVVTNGKLQLYSIDDTLVCEWHGDFDLCVDSCIDLVVIMQGVNFPSGLHRYLYEVIDSNNTVVLSDTLRVDSSQYTDRDTVCLPMGVYEVAFTQQFSSTTENVHVRIDPFHNTSGPLATGQGDLSFQMGVFSACLDTTNNDPLGVDAPAASDVVIHTFQSDLYIMGVQSSDAEVFVFDMRGRCVYSHQLEGELNRLFVGNISRGLYVVQVKDGSQSISEKVFIE